MKRESISLALNDLDERHISDTAAYSPQAGQGSPERIVPMNKKRIITFALAAVLILALGITAYAGGGLLRAIGTHAMPKTGEYSSLAELPKIEKDVGFPMIVPEDFSNGYRFSDLKVNGEAVYGENNEVLTEYYTVHALYAKPGSAEIRLVLGPVFELPDTPAAPEPGERRTVGGVPVELTRDHYKVVPEDYEKTEDDLAREAEGHFYISFGSDEIEEYELAFAGFRLDGVEYTLMDMAATADSPDILAQMAEEIIAVAEN